LFLKGTKLFDDLAILGPQTIHVMRNDYDERKALEQFAKGDEQAFQSDTKHQYPASLTKIKSEKFIVRLHRFVELLKEHSRDLVVHRMIDQFYYMQKEVQIQELSTQLDEALRNLETVHTTLEQEYRKVYYQWRKDVRWMSRYRSGMEQKQKEEKGVSIP
jgi:hypothetical protein